MKRRYLWLLMILLVYLILLVPTVKRFGITFDEQIDIDIARCYLPDSGGWFADSGNDPSQTRLPMYITAIIFFIFHTKSILCARLISCAVGALTIAGAYFYCERNFDYKRGLLASLILATSPYFLSFARVALTESDIFVACLAIWTLFAMSVLLDHRKVGAALWTGLLFGLALSAKISAIAIAPAFVLAIFFIPPKIQSSVPCILGWEYVKGILLLATPIAVIFVLWLSGSVTAWNYIILFAVWSAAIVYFYKRREFIMANFQAIIFVGTLAFSTFLIIPPVHAAAPRFFKYLANLALYKYGHPSFVYVLEVAGLNLGSILFKSSIAIGAWLWLSFLISAAEWRGRRDVRLPILVFALNFLFLIKMPAAQTFWMMPLLPLLAIFGADQLLKLHENKHYYLTCIISALMAACLIMDMFSCYPDYNLNGFQWLGARRFWGRSSIGARSIVQVSHDGVEQTLLWANNNIAPGAKVVTYIKTKHIIRSVCLKPKFILFDGLTMRKDVINDADYVMVSINAIIRQGEGEDNPTENIFTYPYDKELLEKRFEKIISVKRAFGIEVASVWRKK